MSEKRFLLKCSFFVSQTVDSCLPELHVKAVLHAKIASYSNAALPKTMTDNDPQLCQMDLSVILLSQFQFIIMKTKFLYLTS